MESKRLSDRILFALQLALEQGDLHLCEQLNTALEKSLARAGDGNRIIERRDFATDHANAMNALNTLRQKQGKA